MTDATTMQTLVSLARHRAKEAPDRAAYTYLNDGFADPRVFSWQEVDERARAMAALLAVHCRPGDRALVVLPPGPDFLFSFLGCLYAGVIAVPAPMPARARDIARLSGLHASATPSAVIATRPVLDGGVRAAVGVPCIAPDDVPIGAAADWSEPLIDASSIAFLQYTSGSTGNPKGVIVSHANILANEAMISEAFGHDATSTVIGWLPHFHDMGLIGNILQPLYAGSHAVLMSPMAFMRDPLGWLRTISRYRGRTSGGPNFAYELCVRRYTRNRARLDLDLSCWDLAFIGAEPIRAATLQNFADAFAPYGFQASSLFPCYGLAETTLFVTGSRAAARPADNAGTAMPPTWERGSSGGRSSVFVGCGRAATGIDLQIVNPETLQACPDGVEGEVLVAGPNVSAGYWMRPDETALTFGHRLTGLEGAYLRTGDLAVRKDREVYITGRLRDIIIVAGQNYYPQDLEETTDGVGSGVRPGHSAAFAFPTPAGERVGLVCEVSDARVPLSTLCEQIRAAIADTQSICVDAIVLIEPRTLPKTTSGKIERRATQRSFLDGTLRAIGASSLLESSEVWHQALEAVRVDRPHARTTTGKAATDETRAPADRA